MGGTPSASVNGLSDSIRLLSIASHSLSICLPHPAPDSSPEWLHALPLLLSPKSPSNLTHRASHRVIFLKTPATPLGLRSNATASYIPGQCRRIQSPTAGVCSLSPISLGTAPPAHLPTCAVMRYTLSRFFHALSFHCVTFNFITLLLVITNP